MDNGYSYPPRTYLAVVLGAVVLYLAYRVFAPFFVPLFWGAVLGVLFYPLYRRLNRLLRGHSTLSSLLLTLAVLVLVLLPILGLIFEIVTEAVDFVQRTQQALGVRGALFGPESVVGHYLWPLVHRLGLTREELRQAVTFLLQNVGGFAVALGSYIIGNVVGLIIEVLFTLVALYYAFKDGPLFLERLEELAPLPREEVRAIVARLNDVVRASVFSTFAVAAAQGVAGGLLFLVLSLPNPVLWGTVMGAVSLIPVAGPPVIWVPVAIYLIAVGEYSRAAVLVAAGTLVVATIDNVLRPLLIHGRVHIHNFYLFFGILGGIYFMGFTGILFGPILVSLSLTVLRIYQERRDAQALRGAEGGAG
jgi:predicted PurR-regulated permease PerM